MLQVLRVVLLLMRAREKLHKFKGRTGDGQAVAKCGRRVPSHLIVSYTSDVTCLLCLKQIK